MGPQREEGSTRSEKESMDEDFTIPAAPEFYPSAEEFLDPLGYIRKIRAEASKAGICKIIPPEGWSPPTLVEDSLQFSTTLQSTHKLRNRSPAPEVFMKRLRMFHRHERRLHRTRQQMMAELPREVQKSMMSSQSQQAQKENLLPKLRRAPRVSVTDTHGTGLDLRELLRVVRHKRRGNEVPWEDVAREMRLYHPKNPKELEHIFDHYLSTYETACNEFGDNFLEEVEKNMVEKRREQKQKGKSLDDLSKAIEAIACRACGRRESEEQMLLCDSCDVGWHAFCLTPKLLRLPPDNELWFCPECDPKADKEFGFDAGEDFALEDFREYANAFKENWFRQPKVEPTVEEIEREYWKVTCEADRLVYIPYGSDLDTRSVGSGFPNPRVQSNLEHDEYLRCPWNLNIFPELNGSLLSYLDESIKGVSVPWLYIGMMFSSFCYHTEDSYMYSINYHHFGAPKVWYGTPGGPGAAYFEAAMRSAAPELFQANPGLFYHLTTMVSPSELEARGAKLVRAVQKPGEYVITFPQAYHGGFSTGFNCGEAVNFITADWIPFGRAAAARYKMHKWEPALCHEEIILRAVFSTYFERKTHPRDARLLFGELSYIIHEERQARSQMMEPISNRKRVSPAYLKKQRCVECKQIPYLSAVAVNSGAVFFCSEHWRTLPNFQQEDAVAMYSYSDDELSKVLDKVKQATVPRKAPKTSSSLRKMVAAD